MDQSDRQLLTSTGSGTHIVGSSTVSKSGASRRNPARVAWIILISAFTVFCILAVAIPWATWQYIHQAMQANRAEVATISGITQVKEEQTANWLAIGSTRTVAQGDYVQTDESARSMLTVYEGQSDYVLATVHVFGGTRLMIKEAAKPRFSASHLPNRVIILLENGRLRLNPGPSLNRDLELKVIVPAGAVVIEEGSTALEVTADATEISVRSGHSIVVSAQEELVVETGEAAVLASDGTISGPLPSGRNLLQNGDFGNGLSLGWEVYNDQGTDGGSVDGRVYPVEDNGSRSVSFERLGGQQDHCETGIRQILNKDVTDYVSLRIRVDLTLVYQSLSGGGVMGSEFPIMIKLHYRDAQGHNQVWYHGFYYENPMGLPTPYADEVERNIEFAYESDNLMVEQADIRPVFIESIEVAAAGHDYQSRVSEVQLVVE